MTSVVEIKQWNDGVQRSKWLTHYVVTLWLLCSFNNRVDVVIISTRADGGRQRQGAAKETTHAAWITANALLWIFPTWRGCGNVWRKSWWFLWLILLITATYYTQTPGHCEWDFKASAPLITAGIWFLRTFLPLQQLRSPGTGGVVPVWTRLCLHYLCAGWDNVTWPTDFGHDVLCYFLPTSLNSYVALSLQFHTTVYHKASLSYSLGKHEKGTLACLALS